MEVSTIEATIKQALNLAHRPQVERQEYRVAQTRDYFQSHRAVFNKTLAGQYALYKACFPPEAVEYMAATNQDHSTEAALADLERLLPPWAFLYKPKAENSVAALQCGLLPLIYDYDYYLTWQAGQGGLYPRMDAYQMLTSGTVPRDSLALSNPERFQELLGETTALQAYDTCRWPEPRVTITYYEPQT